ncbi:hypothetical protein P7K49_012088, partial [Saguinus oedipus]
KSASARAFPMTGAVMYSAGIGSYSSGVPSTGSQGNEMEGTSYSSQAPVLGIHPTETWDQDMQAAVRA